MLAEGFISRKIFFSKNIFMWMNLKIMLMTSDAELRSRLATSSSVKYTNQKKTTHLLYLQNFHHVQSAQHPNAGQNIQHLPPHTTRSFFLVVKFPSFILCRLRTNEPFYSFRQQNKVIKLQILF